MIGETIVNALAPGDTELATTRFNALPETIQKTLTMKATRQASHSRPINTTTFDNAVVEAKRIIEEKGL